MHLAVEVVTYVATLGVGYLLGFIVGIQNRRAKFLTRILHGSLQSPISRDVTLGRITQIGNDDVGIIKLDHRADVDNFEIGDYIRAISGDDERLAIAVVIMKDPGRGLIQVAMHHHPLNKLNTAIPANPFDWQPGDILMPFDPIV